MNWYTLVPALLILLCFIILVTKLSIKVLIFYTEEKKQVLLRVRVGVIPFTIDVLRLLEKRRQKKKDKSGQEQEEQRSFSEWFEKIPDLIKSIGDIHTILKDFLRKVKVKQFAWSSHIGTGDAATTGILAGYVWSVKGIVAGLVHHYMKVVRQPKLEVQPVFQGMVAATQLECAISFRIVQVIVVAVKLFRYIRKHRSVFIEKTEHLHH